MELFVKDKYSIVSYIHTCIKHNRNNICNDILNHIININFYIGQDNNIFLWCCKYGSIKQVKFILSNDNSQIDELMPEFNIILQYNRAFYYACINDNPDIASYILEIKPDINIYGEHNKTFHMCCGYNKLNSVKYLLSLDNNLLNTIELNAIFNNIWEDSCLETIKYLMSIDENNIIKNQIMDTKKLIFSRLCEEGHLDTLKFLISFNNDLIDRFDKDEEDVPYFKGRTPIHSCINKGKLEMFKYMLSLNKNIKIDNDMLDRTLENDTSSDCIKMVKYLLLLNSNLVFDSSSFVNTWSIFDLEDLKYLISLNIVNMDHITINRCFNSACLFGNLINVKYLYDTYLYEYNNVNNQPFIDMLNCVLKVCCEYGYLYLIKYIISISDNININIDDDTPFRLACNFGHFNIVKYLLALENNNIDISVNDNYPFKIACEKGHLDIVKYILHLKNNIIDIKTINYAFRMACVNGNFKLIKYLLELENNIDIHDRYDYVFRQEGMWPGSDIKLHLFSSILILKYILEHYLNKDKYHYYYYKNGYYIVKPHIELQKEIVNKKLDNDIIEIAYNDYPDDRNKTCHYVKRYEFFDVYYLDDTYIDDCVRAYEIYYNRFQKKGIN